MISVEKLLEMYDDLKKQEKELYIKEREAYEVYLKIGEELKQVEKEKEQLSQLLFPKEKGMEILKNYFEKHPEKQLAFMKESI